MGHAAFLVSSPIFEVPGFDELEQRIAKQKAVVAIIKSESHYVEVGWKMFDADLMPSTYDAAMAQASTEVLRFAQDDKFNLCRELV